MKALIALFVAVLAVSATAPAGNRGLDLSIYSGVTTVSQFHCLQQEGFDFMIIEEYVENHVATNFQATYANAITAGFKEVDAYAFICNTCKGTHTATDVVTAITGNLGSAFNGMIWLDIEPCSGCWSSNGEANFVFAQSIANALQAAGHKIGIYSSGWAWAAVMPGVKSTEFSKYPLWYAHYDNVESFNDPNSYKFQGWTQPAIKQYQGDKAGICKVPDYDVNWAPSFVNQNGPSGAAQQASAPSTVQPAPSAAPSAKAASTVAPSSSAKKNSSTAKSSAAASAPKSTVQCSAPEHSSDLSGMTSGHSTATNGAQNSNASSVPQSNSVPSTGANSHKTGSTASSAPQSKQSTTTGKSTGKTTTGNTTAGKTTGKTTGNTAQ